MLCLTLTLPNRVPAESAEQIVSQLVASLNVHPGAVGPDYAAFEAVGDRQVQGFLSSADETVGFILSVARSATWGVHLALLGPSDGGRRVDIESAVQSVRTSGQRSLTAPGGVIVEFVRDRRVLGAKHAPELGPIESTLQLLCAIERRRSEEGQEAGLMINGGKSQAQTAQLLGVSQQAVSARLRAGYWYESRKVAYWLAEQIEQLTT